MREPLPIRVALGRSRLAAALVMVAYLATAALLAFAPGPKLLRAAAVVPIGVHAVWTLRRWALRTTRSAVVRVELSADGRAALIERGGRRRDGRVQPASYVGEWLTTLVIRPDGARTSRAIAILPDMLPAEDLRQLRVLLRVAGSAPRHH
jgi:membrane-bound toxin of toxin-antitoxin system